MPFTVRAASADTAARGDALEEIVVTAEKRASTVQDTPISMTARSGELLQQEGISGITGIVQAVPGISMRTAGAGQTELEMRGLSSSGGSSPTVGFYLDDYPLTPAAAALNGKVVIDPDLFDLETTSLPYPKPVTASYKFMARVNNSLVGRSTDVQFNYATLPAYDLVRLRFGLVGEHLSGFLLADNLTDKRAELGLNTTRFSWTTHSLERIATNHWRRCQIQILKSPRQH